MLGDLVGYGADPNAGHRAPPGSAPGRPPFEAITTARSAADDAESFNDVARASALATASAC